ncbi:MAG: hypothetical protein N7Q72_02830, partial [Spiroplasma sp. Tabriz.8]|nr:hypothetical protein [Spiroplasma sp. Tabriz.8]
NNSSSNKSKSLKQAMEINSGNNELLNNKQHQDFNNNNNNNNNSDNQPPDSARRFEIHGPDGELVDLLERDILQKNPNIHWSDI